MTTAIIFLLVLVVVAIIGLIGGRYFGIYRAHKGKMVVQCPETRKTVAVDVDAKHAATHSSDGKPDLRLNDCTRWPERADCGQDCLTQVERSPEDCLVRNQLSRWYGEGTCAYCGKGFKKVDSYDHKAVFSYDKKPGLRSPEGRVVQWSDVPVETLPEVLESHQPVCWDCVIAETFRKEHPELVSERPPEDHA
jgi:hypothetical protein